MLEKLRQRTPRGGSETEGAARVQRLALERRHHAAWRADCATSDTRISRTQDNVLNRCKLAQPYINRYLPDESFKTLLLLIGLVMLGVALKGFFMFLQEVLVADVMQLTLFDIRNDVLPAHDQPRSGELLRPGLVRADGPVHERHGFVRPGAQYAHEQGDPRADAVRDLPGGALWINWRLTCLTLILVPISGATTYRVGKIMKRAVRRSLESMSTIYKILQESFQGIKIVKAFATERVERRRFFERDQEPLPQERPRGDDRRHVRPGPGDADPDDRGHRAPGRLVPGAEPDHLPESRTVPASARRRADGDPGSADALHHAGRRVRPDPQARQRPLQDPASGSRGRPDLRPHGPAAKGFREQACPARCHAIARRSSSTR